MSNAKSPQDWTKDWQAMQSQYWNVWSDATRGVAGGVPEMGKPWHEGLEQWARMFSDSGKQSETLDRLMASAKGYTALMQSMVSAAAGKPFGENPTQAWADALRQGFNLPGVDAALLNNPMASMLRGIRGEGARGFEELSASFAPFLAQAKQEGMSWLRAPAFGYAREHQEHYQKMLVAFAEFQEAVKQYNALILKSSQRSFEIFESKLAERAEPGRQIDSLRGLYDVWVDAAEEAYAEIALSPEFRKVYGDVVNSQMRVRSQIQQEVERIGVDLGMPTRTELNSVHKRLHDLRREFRKTHGTDAAAQIAALHAEVQALKHELAGKQGRSAPVVNAAKPAQKASAAPKHKRASAAAKPRAASRSSGTTFSDAISAMKGKKVSAKPRRSAK